MKGSNLKQCTEWFPAIERVGFRTESIIPGVCLLLEPLHSAEVYTMPEHADPADKSECVRLLPFSADYQERYVLQGEIGSHSGRTMTG